MSSTVDTFSDGVRSIISVLRPKWPTWTEIPIDELMVSDYPARAYAHREGFTVISAVETISKGSQGPEYHISISARHRSGTVKRCSSNDARWVLRQFGLEGAKEDNHVPGGLVRNFWRAVAEPLIGLDCECVAEEPAIVEDKGDFVWRG